MQTYHFRIKDSTHINWLCKKAGIVNHIWNEVQAFRLSFYNLFGDLFSEYDIHKICKFQDINSATVQLVIKNYIQKSKQFKKLKLKWRTSRKSLGWIPFDKRNFLFDYETGTAIYMNRSFKLWYSQKVDGTVLCGSFNQDASGHWFLNITTDAVIEKERVCDREIGIDLGCKEQITCSDGVVYERENLTRKFADKLATAQRAEKKRQVTKIHRKIRNIRNDWNHKVTTDICRTSKLVVVGNIGAKGLCKTRMAKSIFDVATFQIKSMLLYKAIRHCMDVLIVSEKFSTITCSVCHNKTGPSGLSGLGVRAWDCPKCGTHHHRDVNAAINILSSVRGI